MCNAGLKPDWKLGLLKHFTFYVLVRRCEWLVNDFMNSEPWNDYWVRVQISGGANYSGESIGLSIVRLPSSSYW